MLWDGYTDCITKGGAREMKSSRSIIHYSLFAALIGMTPMCADAGLRVGNHSRSYAEAYRQVNALQNPDINAVTTPIVTTASEDTENNLPVRVADETLVEQIKSGDADAPVAFNQLEQCSMIYPTGEFEWDSPSLGSKAGISDTCVAVVELRGYQAAADGSDLVLARAKLAAGDTFKCNISSFPESSMIVQAVESFTFPADAEPTMKDVEKQLNQEQKQNAGLKIAAGTVIGALAGNIVGEGERGSDSLFGTGKEKIQSSIIGGVTGAALMAGNSYAGKVAGDVILSTGVNAAAGSVVGNIVATGDSVLRIEDCKLPTGEKTTCLWGYIAEGSPLKSDEQAYYDVSTGDTYVCNKDSSGCKIETLISIRLDAYPNMDIASIGEQQFQTILSDSKYQYFMAINDKNEVNPDLIDDGELKIFNFEVIGLSPNAGNLLLQYFAMLYNGMTDSKDAYEDNGNILGINCDKTDKEFASKFERLDFNEKLDVFSEIIIRYDNETYFNEKTLVLSLDSKLSGYDIAKQIQNFKN